MTEVVHGHENTEAIENLIEMLFNKDTNFSEFSEDEILEFAKYLPVMKKGVKLVDALVDNGLAESK